MPRQIAKANILNNMESIIKNIKSKYFDEILKFDGITIEFTCKTGVNRDVAKKIIETFC